MAPRPKPVASLKRQRKQPPNVEDWVYRFLGNLAAMESMNVYKMHPALDNDRRSSRRVRSPTPYSWAQVTDRGDSDDDVEQPPLLPSNSRIRAGGSPTMEVTDATDQRTLLQRINHYIRAGIAEGKRRAKRYVRKALSFALETGYLLPADREGKLLRVAPSLVHAVKPVAARKASEDEAASRVKPRQSTGRVDTHRDSHRRDKRSSRTRSGAVTRAERHEACNNEREDKRRRNEEVVIKRSKSSDKSSVQSRKSGSSMSSNKETTDGAVKPAMRVDSDEVDRKPTLPVT